MIQTNYLPRRYTTFYPLPVAHLLLLGIVKDFWKYWLRKKDSEGKAGDNTYRIPDQVKHKLERRAKAVQLTKEHTKRAGDLKCASVWIVCDCQCRYLQNGSMRTPSVLIHNRIALPHEIRYAEHRHASMAQSTSAQYRRHTQSQHMHTPDARGPEH